MNLTLDKAFSYEEAYQALPYQPILFGLVVLNLMDSYKRGVLTTTNTELCLSVYDFAYSAAEKAKLTAMLKNEEVRAARLAQLKEDRTLFDSGA